MSSSVLSSLSHSQCRGVVPVDDLGVQLEELDVQDEDVATLRADVEVAAVLGEAALGDRLTAVEDGSVCVCVCDGCVCVRVCV